MTTLEHRPPEQLSAADFESALIWIAGGATSASEAARAADPSAFGSFRTAEGMSAAVRDVRLGQDIADLLTPGDQLAAEMAAAAARRAAAMAELEAAGWTPETAVAALRASGHRPAVALARKAAAA